ncbi:protein of unknown function [Candidatus Hydrogenisulfobacillus filiaventi]|uniref:Efflux RND transporter permease subunit n=1 Tax=Candidatus Hydrogenisulfobacillus filiaventi TaxID=2707344 RepID=A0A6F8ZG33_9FIRM|nr:protein of unknown function [Candidatus Hydrogenisulfobacillus filiaventi]
MTTATMVGSMLPLALSRGAGASERIPIAVTLIGGLTTSTLLTLVVVPVVYSLVDDARGWAARFRGRSVPALRPEAEGDGAGRIVTSYVGGPHRLRPGHFRPRSGPALDAVSRADPEPTLHSVAPRHCLRPPPQGRAISAAIHDGRPADGSTRRSLHPHKEECPHALQSPHPAAGPRSGPRRWHPLEFRPGPAVGPRPRPGAQPVRVPARPGRTGPPRPPRRPFFPAPYGDRLPPAARFRHGSFATAGRCRVGSVVASWQAVARQGPPPAAVQTVVGVTGQPWAMVPEEVRTPGLSAPTLWAGVETRRGIGAGGPPSCRGPPQPDSPPPSGMPSNGRLICMRACRDRTGSGRFPGPTPPAGWASRRPGP